MPRPSDFPTEREWLEGLRYEDKFPPIPGRHRDTPDPPPVARIGGQPYDPDDVPDRRDVE